MATHSILAWRKEGPQLERTGASQGFPRAAAPVGVLFPGPNIPLQGSQGSRGCIPGSPGESGLVWRESQGLRSPLESRRGSLGAP